MNFKKNESQTKLRGGYYTPDPIADFLANWVLKIGPQSILEPGCGDGVFIRALSKKDINFIKITGIEKNIEEAKKCIESSRSIRNLEIDIINENFLEWYLRIQQNNITFDGVLGNPPYIRYQYLDPSDQVLSESIFNKFQLRFTKHTNAWVPFVIASINLLTPGGRLGMVIPSEILHVLHADSLRKFLLSQCSKIIIIDPNDLLFEDALQGTVLLLAIKKINPNISTEGVAIVSEPDQSFLFKNPEEVFSNANFINNVYLNGKWMNVLLTETELMLLQKAKSFQTVKRFSDIASVDVGIVTGANKFFLVNNEIVEKYNLHNFAKPMFGRSDHCPGVIYSEEVHKENIKNGLPTHFIQFGEMEKKDMPFGALNYIEEGEKQELHKRYKCSIRTPWYNVPSIYSTELGMLKRTHNYPRLILNTLKAFTTDTAYRIKTKVVPEKLVYCFINSLTALSAELEGRHYGGGVLELVPSEIEKLLIPLGNLQEYPLHELDKKISNKENLEKLFFYQDNLILKSVGFSDSEIEIIHNAWIRIRNRRQRLLGNKDTLIEG